MALPDWRNLDLNNGVLRERIADDNRLVLWLPGNRDGGVQHWERIGAVAGAEISVGEGICSTAATAIQARRSVRGFFGKLLQRFRQPSGQQVWLLPNGQSAEQWGERQTDLILVWAEDETIPLDETRLIERWPAGKRFEQIGKNLFVVSGVEAAKAAQELKGEAAQALECPDKQAEKLLAGARAAGDRRKEASALADLGVVHLHAGDARGAVTLLEQALASARQLGDRSMESDVLGNLGAAVLAVGQPKRALELLEEQLACARAGGDRFNEKAALQYLGDCYSGLRDPARAIAFYDQALAIARAVGDRYQEPNLLWSLAIQNAQLGQRDQVFAWAQAAIDLWEKLADPRARWFASNLQKYRLGDPDGELAGTAHFGQPVVASAVPVGGQTPTGPGILRMALSAAKSLAKWVGSGFKMVPSEIHKQRLQTCITCEHHTGMRCKICGCFTNAKAWMPQEYCPIGKW